jgi:hypothetical protein
MSPFPKSYLIPYSVHCVIISMSMIRTRWHRYHHTPYILFLRKASSGIEDTSFELAYTLRRSRLPLCLHFQHHRDYVRFRNVEHTCKHEGSNDIPSNDIPNEMPSASPVVSLKRRMLQIPTNFSVAISGLSGFCRDDISWPAFISSLDLVAVRTLGTPSTLCGSVINVGRDKISIIWTALATDMDSP